jgi:diguanylate cyclase (GGDEF)-like protein/PAS domain S-box-containing protein
VSDRLPDAADTASSLFSSTLEHLGTLERDQLESLARDLDARYRVLVDRLPGVMYVDTAAADATMIDVSERVEELFGITRDEWLSPSFSWVDIVHPDDRPAVLQADAASRADGSPFRVEYRGLRSDGTVVRIREEAVLVRGDDQAPLFWLGQMLDVTEFTETRRALDEQQAKYGALVEQIPAIVYIDIADASMTTSYVSPQIEEILGVTPERYCADPDLWASMLHPEDRERTLAAYLAGRSSASDRFSLEYRLIAPDGRIVWFRDHAAVIRDESGTPRFIQGVMLDITEEKAAAERLEFLAFHDELTGLPNRTMFAELLELSVARGKRSGFGVAVLHVDIDDFRLVNNSLGHEVGDRLLQLLAERLRDATRETDFAARQGADEFLLLLSDMELTSTGGIDGALVVVEGVTSRIHEALREPFELGGTEVYATASVGVSIFPRDADGASTLLRHAESAMMQAKKTGRGGHAIHVGEDPDAKSRLDFTTRLRKAVENQNWTLHYQPLVQLNDASTVGVEALIRWQEPNGGLVPPNDFIPLAEEMGLIEAIGDWVVEEIGRQDQAWRADGLELEIGFNLSPRQLWQPDLVQKISSSLIAAGVDPTMIVAEITESTAMTDPDRTQRILFSLHDQGLRIAIDDFGTGYSSLARLKHLPVDILKIDRSFIRDVDLDRDAGSMVSAMIALASNLGMTPLAEGIETEGEWRFLADRGCAMGQGYFFSRPVPAEEILAQHRRTGLRLVGGEAR